MRAGLRAAVLAAVAGQASCATAPAPARDQAGALHRHAAIAADHPAASAAGLEMLRRGGNAVDAAVAASFCLSVVRPFSCGIGGGGFMVIYRPAVAGREASAVALDYRETAPAAVNSAYYVATGDLLASRDGVRAAGVPGTVAGLLYALDHYGTLERPTVLGPAIRAAEGGFEADEAHVAAAAELARRLRDQPGLAALAAPIRSMLCLDGAVRPGDRLRNPQQAAALRLIARDGREAFYEGPIAEAIVTVMSARGGPMTARDLAGYRVRATPPLRGTFQGLEVLAMPPPSSGGIATLQVLGILDRRLGDLGPPQRDSPAYVHLVTEAMKHAFADRATWLADPAFVDVPAGELLDERYLDGLAASISLERTRPPVEYGSRPGPPDDGGTSHLSVIDGSGMAVACTETINLQWGSMVAVPGFGFALNDEMDDFTTIPGEPNAFGLRQSDRNLPEPGKRPLSSMSPTIVLSGGRPLIVAGASGGPRIITATLQCILDCVLFDMTPAAAVAAPRFHHQWMPAVLEFEETWTDRDAIDALEEMGHVTGRREEVGVVQMIRVSPDGIRAASDPRKGGAPAGY